jgi:putative phosphoesterase
MRLGVISDIHGDIEALERAWGHIESLGVERTVCAGDLVGYGAHPDRVVQFLTERRIASVRGNHDHWAALRPIGKADRFGGAPAGAESRAYLQGLPPCLFLSVGGRFVAVTHAAPDDGHFRDRPRMEALAGLRAYLDLLGAKVLIVGHTHEPCWHRTPSGLIVNPGSIAGPAAVRGSRTFAIIDLAGLSVTFYDARSGRALIVAPAELATPAADEAGS